MKLIYANYERKYLNACMELIRTTWLFEDELDMPQNSMPIYQNYVETCAIWSDYLELLIDERNMV